MTPDTLTFHIITLFPQVFNSVFSQSIIKRAIGKKIVKINLIDPRDFATDKHKSVDDKPYGGGMGMVMRPDIVIKALESISTNSYKLLLCASGKKYTQKTAQKLKSKREIVLICGHYEGLDARVEKYVDEVISVGDFVMTGGEIPAMAIVDSITRLLPGVITEGSTKSESFSLTNYKPPTTNYLEYPQYTRPENFRGQKVPKVLLSGDHKKIEQWRKKESLKRTKRYRPDLVPSAY